MSSPFSHSVRLSDAEREQAMAALGRAFSEGRLDVVEYDERCRAVAEARTQVDLEPIFADIPRFGVATTSQAQSQEMRLYSAMEIEEAHRQGKHTRLGLLSLSGVVGLGGAVALDYMHFAAPELMLFIFPIVFILLYLMKVGPDSWYVPSPAAVERQRLRELRMAHQTRNMELKMLEQNRLAELKMQRKQQTQELTNKAMAFVNRSLDKKPNR